MFDCLVVGAGLAGLLAAKRLQESGYRVVIVEKSRGVGGRMATRRMEANGRSTQAVFDHGAQFFTVRDKLFDQMVAEWRRLGVVVEWSRGFATADGSYYADGHPRYRGKRGMTDVPKYLAHGLDLRLEQRVDKISHTRSGTKNVWQTVTDDGTTLQGRSLILTPPVPQGLSLLDAGRVQLPSTKRKDLEKIQYDPCIALLIMLAGASNVPEPGGMWPVGEPIAWVADNYRKGISPIPGSITLHAGPEFSTAHWATDDQTVIHLLLQSVEPWLNSAARSIQVHRWRYSKPIWIHPEPCLTASELPGLVFAGDAFAGPRVEGAALSGLAAAEAAINAVVMGQIND